MFQVIRQAIPAALCRSAAVAFPGPEWQYWHRYSGKTGDKFGSMDRFRIPIACQTALDALSGAVADRIGESFVDYDLHAAGLHMIPPGGFLARHIDAECHPLKPWRRTHSVILFLNEKWEKHYGGALAIETDIEEQIHPEFGTAVIFETKDLPHRVTHVSTSQEVPYRKTLALFAWAHDECDGTTSSRFD